MAVMTALAVGGMVVGAGMGVASAIKANEDQKEFEEKQREQAALVQSLEDSRQQVINPMAGLTNEAEKIGVATAAARFQAEEADMALANTLDTIMATGGGAAGATALAQMALKSKQGISADIQKQELQNAKNIANTQMVVNQQIAEGEKYAWEQNEIRELQKLDRAQNLADKYEAQAYAAEAQKWEAYGAIAGSLTSGMGNIAGAIQNEQAMDAYNQALSAYNAGGGTGNLNVSLGSMGTGGG